MVDAWNFIVGGLVAALSGVATQWTVHIIRTREERRNRVIAKFEELVAAIYEHDRWMDAKLNYHTFREGEIPGPNPMAKIEALCSIYFPEFIQAALLMDREAKEYVLWMTQAGGKRLRKESDSMDGHSEAYQAYSDASDALLSGVREHGRKTFGAKVKPMSDAGGSKPPRQ